ncbi:MAG: acetyl-CoA carboxylase carboxyltransferase subunit alpha [Gemmatimonadetes bacterium]|nr:acetyl-CoA carboxylase carboxyltransferase subunit alpha [Gemmatimonadota bacterium]
MSAGVYLDFERPIVELEEKIAEMERMAGERGIDVSTELSTLQAKLARLKEDIFSHLTPIQRVQLARHPRRPYPLDLIDRIFTDWLELHGDRAFADDQAMIGGLARFDGDPVLLVGQQKGRDTKENLRRNFGMPHPEGYRKALRLMKLAEKYAHPVISLIDTPGAYPGIGAEERGQAEAIARNLREMAALEVPTISIVTGEGASGGALGIGVTDRILVLENAFYSVISPEGCAAILWKDGEKRDLAARAMKITATDLLELGVIDEIVTEPMGGAHTDPASTARAIEDVLRRHLREISAWSVDERIRRRRGKYREMGAWRSEAGVHPAGSRAREPEDTERVGFRGEAGQGDAT